MSAATRHSVTLWLHPAQAALARAIIEHARLIVMGVGSSEAGRAEALAGELGGSPLSDLRHALSSCKTNAFLILDPGDFGCASPAADAAVLRDAADRGVRVASLEPMPASLLDLVTDARAMGEEPAAGSIRQQWARFVPLGRRTRPIPEVLELLATFGPVRSASIRLFAATTEGSLAARLLDAMDLVLALLGEPETVEASLLPAVASKGVYLAPGESLRGPPALHGDLTANLRFAGGRAASLHLSDQSGPWTRHVALSGPAGRIDIHQHDFEWHAPDSRLLDHSTRPVPNAPAPPAPPAAFDLARDIADQLTSLLAVGSAEPGLPNFPRALALAQAALLSARTGEGETPNTISRMAGA